MVLADARPGMARQSAATALAALTLLAGAVVPARAQSSDLGGYERLRERYQEGDWHAAARELAGWPQRALAEGLSRRPYGSPGESKAAAVLDLHAAALALEVERQEEATVLLQHGRLHLGELWRDYGFKFAWHLASGYLWQGYASHDRAFDCYTQALSLRRDDPMARLARATALEFSVLPDGFGGITVADKDVWPFLSMASRERPPELAPLLADPMTEAPQFRRTLLESLTREYREALERDGSLDEARLRLGRVLQALARRDEALLELRRVRTSADPFVASVAHLCLARLAAAPADAIAAYREAARLCSSLHSAWLGLSDSLRRQGDHDGAHAALARAFEAAGERGLSAWTDYHLGRGRAFPAALVALQGDVTVPR
jgi:tetratricopeptide (TPR) repeat protein